MKIKKIKSKITNLKYGKNCTIIEPVNVYGSSFGKNVFIGPFVEIQKKTKIGDNTRIQSHSFICEKVEIGKNCFIGHGVMFTNDKLKKGKINRNPKSFKKTIIRDNVVIGSNVTLLPVKVISGVVIGAGSIVTKNITKKGIYAGNPAKFLRKI
tara:strand:- start:606 stop:1064 length:459 start_codon:yes stop_codon:yes gene_type:complete